MNVYLVGGAVRDTYMGIEPKDFDYVVVGATPEDMLELGYQQVGADFPVFLHPSTGNEYALARVERKIGDGYHGFEVSTEDVSLTDDLSRRDLTINAMARLVGSETIIDPFGGLEDIENGVLRHVSPAFAEDPLRVIRLGRFYARYNYEIAPETLELARQMVKRGDLNQLPHERFWAELVKVFQEKRAYLFFNFLEMIEATRYIDFFEGLYGQADQKKNEQISGVATLHAFYFDRHSRDASEWLRFHTALTAVETSSIMRMPATDSRTRTLFENVQKMRKLTRGVDSLFTFLKSAKLWQNGSTFTDACDALHWMEARGEKPAFTLNELSSLKEATADIDSFMFIELPPGKELGMAIENARKQRVAQLLNLN